jgi:Fe-S cluster biosynthesis and repair protein YggX
MPHVRRPEPRRLDSMARMVQCVKFGKELEGFDKPPIPGELGKRIYEQVSKEAWKLWTAHMTMLVNEYRLSMSNPDSQKFLQEQLEQFFFGEGSALPPDYVPQQSK